MIVYDKEFVSKVSRIAMKIAFKAEIPKITKMMSEVWKSLDEEQLKDEKYVTEAFERLFNYHSDLARAETDVNQNVKAKKQIEELVKEVSFWKDKSKQYLLKSDKVSEGKKKVIDKKIRILEDSISRKKKNMTEYSKVEITGIDKGLELLDNSIREFIDKLFEIGYGHNVVMGLVHKGLYKSGYGYSSQADISKWVVR